MAGAGEVVVVGVDGEQHGVRLDALVEAVDEALEVGHAADAVVEGSLGHGRDCTERRDPPTEFARAA